MGTAIFMLFAEPAQSTIVTIGKWNFLSFGYGVGKALAITRLAPSRTVSAFLEEEKPFPAIPDTA